MAGEGAQRTSIGERVIEEGVDVIAYLEKPLLMPPGVGKGLHEWAMGWLEAERGGAGACHEVGVFELSRGRCGYCSNCTGRNKDEPVVQSGSAEAEQDLLEVLLDLDGYPEGSGERSYGVVRKTAVGQPHLDYYEQQLLSARPSAGKRREAKEAGPAMLFTPLAALGGLAPRRDQPPPGEALCADLPAKVHHSALTQGK